MAIGASRSKGAAAEFTIHEPMRIMSATDAIRQIVELGKKVPHLETKEFWGGIVADFSIQMARQDGGGRNLYIDKVIERFPLGKQEDTPPLAVDLGCGAASFSAVSLLKAGYKVYAVDFCEQVLPKLQGFVKEHAGDSSRLVARCVDLTTYDFPENAQIVVAKDVLTFCPAGAFEGTLRKVIESLRKGGFFIATLFCEKNAQEHQILLYQMKSWYITMDQAHAVFNKFTDTCNILHLDYNPPEKDLGVYFIAVVLQKK